MIGGLEGLGERGDLWGGVELAAGPLERPSVNVPSRHAVSDDAHTRHGARVCHPPRSEAYAGGYVV